MERKKFSEPQLDTIEGLTAKLIELNAKLKESEQARTRMLENISHDLRAPLTAMRSAIDYFKEIDEAEVIDREEIKQLANLLDKRARTLEVLVNDLYYLTSLDNANKGFKFEEVPLGAFLEEYFFSAEIDDKYAERELILELPDGFEYMVSMDVNRLTRVLDNLFTNALKYSYPGAKIELGAYVPKREEIQQNIEDDKDYVAFYVKDSGIGIAEDKLPYVFDRTFMASDSRTPASTTGSGLGLAIVKGIVEKHGGRITCESKIGVGSCFRVYLPSLN